MGFFQKDNSKLKNSNLFPVADYKSSSNPPPPLLKRPEPRPLILRKTPQHPRSHVFLNSTNRPGTGSGRRHFAHSRLRGSSEVVQKYAGYDAGLFDRLIQVFLEEKGAEIFRGPTEVPKGRNMTVRHLEGRF